MKRHLPVAVAAALLALSLSAPTGVAQGPQASQSWNRNDAIRIVQEVQKRIGSLPYYGVFDWITFGIRGRTLVLKGYASQPVLKQDAGNAVKGIPGIETVDNQIHVLPVSPMDDRIRVQVYDRVYTQPGLEIYNAGEGPLRMGFERMMAGGVDYDPPLGYHAIHIIVENGHVTLYGVVDNTMDSTLANMAANQVPGVFSVDDDLIVPNQKAKKPQ